MAKQCAMIIGFLVPHRCDNKAVATCGKCGRRYCDEHVAMVHGGVLCTACEQGLAEPVEIAKAAQKFDEADYAAFDQALLAADFDSDDMFADLS